MLLGTWLGRNFLRPSVSLEWPHTARSACVSSTQYMQSSQKNISDNTQHFLGDYSETNRNPSHEIKYTHT